MKSFQGFIMRLPNRARPLGLHCWHPGPKKSKPTELQKASSFLLSFRVLFSSSPPSISIPLNLRRRRHFCNSSFWHQSPTAAAAGTRREGGQTNGRKAQNDADLKEQC
jgi:hypothetical protein